MKLALMDTEYLKNHYIFFENAKKRGFFFFNLPERCSYFILSLKDLRVIGVTAVLVEIAASDTFGETVEEAAERTSDDNFVGEEVVVNGSDI